MLMSVILTLMWLVTPAAAADPGEALREAAQRGDVTEVRKLLDAGVPVDAPAAKHGHTALIFAAGKGRLDVVRLLLERGANVNAREDFFMSTPLTAALGEEHFDIARLLLEKGAAQADEALMAAAGKGDEALAKAALASGRLRLLDVKTAIKVAEQSGHASLRPLLEGTPLPAPAQPAAPVAVPEKRLQAIAGRYRARSGEEITVAVKDGGLVITGAKIPEMTMRPVSADRFETAAGDAALLVGGRGGTVEGVALNRDGDVLQMGIATSEPQPLKVAEKADETPAARAEARPWPQFRGASASGIADGQGVPLRWSVPKKEQILFRTPMPGIALSSPIIWGGRIFVTTAVSAKGDSTFRTGLYGDPTSVDDTSEHSFRLLALDAGTGAVVWDKEVHRTSPTVRRHLKSSLANATPVTDGQRVVVLFGAVGVLAAYDFQGAQIWKRDIGVLDCSDPQAGQAEWGHASSPILHGDRVIVQADRRKDSFVAAYRLDNGDEVWRVARNEASTWTTPNILRAAGGDELITNGNTIRAYDPRTGALLWSLGPNSEVVVATPVVGDGVAYLTAGYPPVRPIYAVRPGHRGDLTLPDGASSSDAIAWSHARGGTYIPTPLLYQGHFYTLNNNGLLTCYRADTGAQVYQTRVGEMGTAFSSSPLAADGRLYLASETGDVYVLRAGPEFVLLAANPMDEVVMATPAASDGLLVVRTLGHIVGIGSPRQAAAR